MRWPRRMSPHHTRNTGADGDPVHRADPVRDLLDLRRIPQHNDGVLLQIRLARRRLRRGQQYIQQRIAPPAPPGSAARRAGPAAPLMLPERPARPHSSQIARAAIPCCQAPPCASSALPRPPLPEPVSRARLRAPNGRKPCPLRTPPTVPRSKPFCWPGACPKTTRSRRLKSLPGPICTAWTATASRCCRATTSGGARAR